MKVYVNYDDARWRKYKVDFEKIACMAVESTYKESEVSITLTNDPHIHELNRQYRGIDKPTNVLSFELGDDVLLGDIFISLDTVQREAADANISVAEHVAHMVVHGMLHLQGYDHISDKDAVVMESKEILVLKKMGIKNPYEDVSVACSDFCNEKNMCPGGRFVAILRRVIPRVGGVGQYFLMALCGAIAGFGYAPFNMWMLTVLGIGLAYWIMTRNGRMCMWRAFTWDLPFAAVYAVAMFWWILHSIYVFPELAAQFAIWTVPCLIGIAIAGGIIFSVPFIAVGAISTTTFVRPIIFAATWTVMLWLREWAFTGFPWNPIANISMPWGALANSMSLWGTLGLTFVIIGCIASGVEFLRARRNWRVCLVFLCLGLVGVLYGAHNMRVADNDTDRSPVVRIVQPAHSAAKNISGTRQEALQNADHNLRVFMRIATYEDIPDLVVFPETAYPFVVIDDEMPLARGLGVTTITGATSYDDGKMYNSMLVANPDGKIQKIYNKSHLVPFGEYGPFGTIVPSPGNLTPGNGADIIDINIGGRDLRFVPAICYEIVFSDALVPRGAENIDAIINITNDNWFGQTPGTYQHLDMVRRYAIESGLPVIRANYSGISAFVLSSGVVMASLPVGRAGYLDGVVWGAHMTPYRAIGRDAWMLIILIFSVLVVIIAGGKGKK